MDKVEDAITLPPGVRFPVEIRPPPGFDPERPQTWPRVEGRLEFVGGKLLYIPPCGGEQAETVLDVSAVLAIWIHAHPEFIGRTNEAGMRLGDDSRGADAGIWRLSDLKGKRAGFAVVPPVLAVEVAGQDDDETALREKARWYFAHGVQTVWLVLPDTREVIVLADGVDRRVPSGDSLPEPAGLPDLAPAVSEFFVQISR